MVTHNHKLLQNQVRGLVGGMAGGAIILVALFFYWQFLHSSPEWLRVPIPVSEIVAGKGFNACWRVPESLRALRWHRVGVRLVENGTLLPWRLDNQAQVEAEGLGRFYVDQEWLWFSSSDNSQPWLNGRHYELVIARTKYQAAILAAGSMVVALLVLAVFLPWQSWFRGETVLRLGSSRVAVSTRQLAGGVCGVLALLFLMLPFVPGTFRWRLSMPAEALLRKSSGQFCYYLPRWIRQDAYRMSLASLTENQQPLRLVAPPVLESSAARGVFSCEADSLLFRPADATNPAINGRTYELRVPVFSPRLVTVIFFVWGGLGWWMLLRRPYRVRQYLTVSVVQNGCYYGGLMVIAWAKLILVSGDEIVAAEADAFAYASAVNHLILGIGAAHLPTHPNFFPILAAGVAIFGVPWRLGLEVIFLGAAFFLTEAIRSLVRSRFIAGLTFMLVAWHPWTFSGFRNFMSDPLVLVLITALLATMLRVLNQPINQWRWISFIGLGMLLFFWEWCRHEDVLVYLGYGLFVALVFGVVKFSGGGFRETRWQVATLLAIPVLLVVLGSGVVKWTHYCRYGVYAKSLIHAPGLTALLKALYHIKPDQEIRYAPVTRQSIHSACSVSASLRPYETNLLDPRSINTRIGEYYTKIPGEFGPWLNWLLPSSIPANSSAANQIMHAAAGEINQALKTGILPSRAAWFPLDPNWHHWWPELLPSVWSRIKEGLSLEPVAEPVSVLHKPLVQKVFDDAASRRAASLYPRRLIGQGHLSAPSGTFDSVALTDPYGKLLGASILLSNRWDNALTFDFQAGLESQPANYQLAFFQALRLQQVIPISPESAFTLPVPGTDNKITGQTSVSWVQPEKMLRGQKWQILAARNYGWIFGLSLLLIGVRVFVSDTWGRRQSLGVVAGALLITGWLVLRATLYAFLEVNFSWKAERYMHCVAPVSLIAILFLTVTISAWCRNRFWPLLVREKQDNASAESPGNPLELDKKPKS